MKLKVLLRKRQVAFRKYKLAKAALKADQFPQPQEPAKDLLHYQFRMLFLDMLINNINEKQA